MAMDVALGYSRQAPQTLGLDGYSFTAEWPQRLLWTLGAKGAVVTALSEETGLSRRDAPCSVFG